MIDVGPYADRFERELADVSFPDVALVEREMPTPPALHDVTAAVGAALRDVALPHGSVAIAVGSRGIARIDTIVAALVAALLKAGAAPFIVPAMGSHGASTAEGQSSVLAHLGIDEATVGCPIRATMDTVEVGKTPSGLAVYMDSFAFAADAVIAVNRVKPHTSYRGPIESGPAKMLAIGLGKLEGARSIHSLGWGGMAESVPAAARVAIATGKVAFALAIVENANEEPCRLEAIPGADIVAREPELLAEAMSNLARLPLDRIDVLAVDRVGKNISGAGGDPNVTGRFPSKYITGGPQVRRLVYFALSEDSDGNANGIGLADVVTEELARRYDPFRTYLNALTTTTAENARLPMVMPTRRLAVAAALRMCPDLDAPRARFVRIHDTLHLRRLWLSRESVHAMREPYRILSDFAPLDLARTYDP